MEPICEEEEAHVPTPDDAAALLRRRFDELERYATVAILPHIAARRRKIGSWKSMYSVCNLAHTAGISRRTTTTTRTTRTTRTTPSTLRKKR
jgi:hypothetical protein